MACPLLRPHLRSLRPTARTYFHRRLRGSVLNAVKARWSFDARFGAKQEALELVQVWIQEVISRTGALTDRSIQLSHGAVGVPESKIEVSTSNALCNGSVMEVQLEIEFEDLAGVEAFWGAIPGDYHREWTSRMRDRLVDGSPQWTLHHTVPIDTPTQPPQPDSALQEMEAQAVLLGEDEVIKAIDWKGDEMIIQPGDQLPFRFS